MGARTGHLRVGVAAAPVSATAEDAEPGEVTVLPTVLTDPPTVDVNPYPGTFAATVPRSPPARRGRSIVTSSLHTNGPSQTCPALRPAARDNGRPGADVLTGTRTPCPDAFPVRPGNVPS